MISFFRPDTDQYSENTGIKTFLIGGIIILIVTAFFLQLGMGICPVP